IALQDNLDEQHQQKQPVTLNGDEGQDDAEDQILSPAHHETDLPLDMGSEEASGGVMGSNKCTLRRKRSTSYPPCANRSVIS
ncbi:hypothetical protein A2U01_0083402, partial [Trifolium medium]|nr:hypothetical protein [Trifolium medium]